MPVRHSVPAFLAALAVMLVYVTSKALVAGDFWFHGIARWELLFRPFPDWGSGAALYGALLPAKWLGTRTAMHAIGFLATVIVALCLRAYRLPAYFACEAALIETIDAVWLIRGQAVGWAPPASSGAMIVSLGWVVALLAAAWVFAGQSGSPARATPTAPIPPRPSAAGRWIDRHFVIVCYVVTLAYAGMKLLFAYWWWFDSTGFWMAAFRPFPDWGTGSALFGAILPARWIGTRNLAYGLFLLFGLWLAVRRGEPRMLAILLLQGALIEGFDGLWLANGKFNWLWTGQNTGFYMRGGFLWVPDLLLVGIYMMTRPLGRRA